MIPVHFDIHHVQQGIDARIAKKIIIGIVRFFDSLKLLYNTLEKSVPLRRGLDRTKERPSQMCALLQSCL